MPRLIQSSAFVGVDMGDAESEDWCVVSEHDLINNTVRQVSKDELGLREHVTKHFKAVLGECEYLCEWHPQFGWVPEADCPVHDHDGD